MANYTVTLSAAEEKALGTVMLDIQWWLDNFVHDRAKIEVDRIFAEEVKRKIEAGQTVSGSKDDIVLAANVKSAAEINAEQEAEMQARFAAEQAASASTTTA